MANPLKRGSAPDRERPEHLRPGTFKKGHKKLGGRKRGTPNAFSAEYKRAIIEAAYRIGYDGNGEGGIVGYFKWIATQYPEILCGVLFVSLLSFECEDYATEQPERFTEEDLNRGIRNYIGLDRNKRNKKRRLRTSPSQWDWTGQEFPLNFLMHLAIVDPQAFCKLYLAAFLRPPSKLQRGKAARRAWEQRQQAADQREHSIRVEVVR